VKYFRNNIIKVQIVGYIYINRLLHGKMKIVMLRLKDMCDEKYSCMLGFIFTYIKHITGECLGDYKDHTDLLSAKFLKLLSFRYIFNNAINMCALEFVTKGSLNVWYCFATIRSWREKQRKKCLQ